MGNGNEYKKKLLKVYTASFNEDDILLENHQMESRRVPADQYFSDKMNMINR